MITEDYVSFETAKLLAEKGYCNCAYMLYKENGELVHYGVPLNNDGFSSTLGVFYECPTLQMAMKWLREVHNIGVFPTTFYRHTETFDGHNYGCTLVNLKTFDVIGNFEDCTFPADSYEQTCEAAIKYCLENLI